MEAAAFSWEGAEVDGFQEAAMFIPEGPCAAGVSGGEKSADNEVARKQGVLCVAIKAFLLHTQHSDGVAGVLLQGGNDLLFCEVDGPTPGGQPHQIAAIHC